MAETADIFLIISVIIQCILLVVLIIFVFKFIGILKLIKGNIETLVEEVNGLKTKIDPVIAKVTSVIESVETIAGKVDDNIQVLTKVVDKVADVTTEVADFVFHLKSKIEIPTFDVINTYSSLVKGIKVFFEKMKVKKKPDKIFEGNYLFEGTKDKKEDDYDIDFDDKFNDINKELNEVRKKLEEMKKV